MWIIESSQKAAYQAVNIALVQRNWLLGYRIAEEELGGEERSEYGLQVEDKAARDWYEKEAIEQTWSVRTLQRNISSQYLLPDASDTEKKVCRK